MRAHSVALALVFAAFTSVTLAQDEAGAVNPEFTLRAPFTRSCELAALAVGTTDGTATGHCMPIQVSVHDDRSTTFRVGIYESEVGATGNMWRSAAWMSTSAAALATGFTPATRHVTFDVEGFIDGPSAGGIMTVGILAAARGDEMRTDAAMTGMINPDFSIGPVGGLPHKIRGAAEAGKKLVIIPSGSRVDLDRNLKREVDLMDLGRKLGVEVVPVTDLYTAYRHLTGKDLPRWPSGGFEPRLDEKIERRTVQRTREWLLQYRQNKTRFDNLPVDSKSEVAIEDMELADELAERAQRLSRENDSTGAYRLAFEAAFIAGSSLEAARLSNIYQKQDLDAARRDVQMVLNPWGTIDLAVGKLRGFQPENLFEASGLIEAISCLIEAINFAILADDLLKKEADNEEDALENVVDAGINYHYANVDLESMDEVLEDSRKSGGMPAPPPERVELAAQLFRRAAEANLSMFESMHLPAMARANGMSMEAARVKLMRDDSGYAHLTLGLRVLAVLKKQLGDSPEYHYAVLAAMRDAYIESTVLIAKHYSLDAIEDEYGLVGVKKEQTLRQLLEFSKDQAKRGVHFLEQNGVDASTVASYYLTARLKREGDVIDKVDALSYYWGGYLTAQIIAVLGDFASEIK